MSRFDRFLLSFSCTLLIIIISIPAFIRYSPYSESQKTFDPGYIWPKPPDTWVGLGPCCGIGIRRFRNLP